MIFLTKTKINYVIPIKKDIKIRLSNSLRTRKSEQIFAYLNNGECIENLGELWGYEVKISAYRNEKRELKVLISSSGNSCDLFKIYRKRWSIEKLFHHIKSRGFNIESTYIVNEARLSKLIAAIMIATAILVKNGHIKEQSFPIKIKIIKDIPTKEHSLFLYGLLHLKNAFNLGYKKLKSAILKIFCNPCVISDSMEDL